MADSSAAGEDMANKYCPRFYHWKLAEDEKLRQLVRQHGPHNWDSIAENLEGRSGKSCRLRWLNHLDPKVNKKPFTEEENERLLAAREVYGNKWAAIAKLFPGRTPDGVKNQWNLTMAQKQREDYKKRSFRDHNTASNTSSSNSLPNKGALAKPYEPLYYMRGLYSEESASSSSEKESKDSGQKEVPFYDFLGVGGSDDQ
ncbi:Transcription factor MYB44 [Spatholobus suberectus]|nr:Transcription factor MYB44 [Spatholobus suberectus]